MTCGTFVYNNEKNALDDDDLFGSSSCFATLKKLAQDDDEPKGLVSSCAIFKK